MEINNKDLDKINLMSLNGRLDAGSAKDLKEAINALIKNKSTKIIVDMADVDFIDSTGLGSLVAALRSVNKEGGDIRIVSLQEQVRAIFELTRLHRIFEIFDDHTDAMKNF